MAMRDPKVMSVMIIEANPNIRSIMRGIVHDIGIKNIKKALDIETGVQKFKEAPVDLIFTDWSEDVDAR